MCLAIPGKLVDKQEVEGSLTGRVQFGGIHRQACLDFLPEAEVGDYVLVHVGFAISRIDEEEARKSYEYLEKAGLIDEELNPILLEAPGVPPVSVPEKP
jgi:hydrogenase expression/formation protein HypC